LPRQPDSGLIPFHCPEHGWRLDASPAAQVTCGEQLIGGRCAKVCYPPEEYKEARERALDRVRKRKGAKSGKRPLKTLAKQGVGIRIRA
jgi:hypothetical protein